MLNRLSLNRIGLNRIGLNRIGKPSGGSSDRPYIDPKVLDSLCGVWIMDQNTNESESRNIIKNKIADRGGDLELLNFAYKANSGYNGYPEDFTSWNTSSYNVEVSKDGSKVKSINNTRFALQYSYTAIGRDIPSFKVKISNLTEGYIKYFYRNEEGVEEVLTFFSTDIDESEIIELPKSHNTVENGTGIRGGFDSANANIGVTIEQLPLYEGALVTDGKDDMIVSQKTVQEMLGGSKEITVVSMAVNLDSQEMMCNSIFTNTNRYNIRNTLDANKVVSILGYTDNNVNTNNINLIMGDKNSIKIVDRVNYNASYPFYPINYPSFYYKAAVYWTFISNKVLTTDEINQIIGYYKLDKYVTPQVIYDVKRQGLTNDTPNEDWYLKDFSGNGHDMQLYNYAKTPESGINEEGGLQSDGVNDYGKAERLPIFKDYTVVADRALIGDGQGAFMTKSSEIQMGAFGLEIATGEQISFGNSLHTSIVNKDRSITYMSTYSYNGQPNTKGTREDGSYLCLATIKPGDSRFSSVALWSLLLFPYSLSEFLLERQLKKYKLGTLYPDMVEFRPVISGNIPYNAIEISQGSTTLYNKSINKTGIYLQEGSAVRVYIQPSGIDEVSKITINGIEYTDLPINPNGFYYADFPITKSPQKISYAIDEYIRYEDIVQPYPAIINLKQDGKTITWGDKLKVGSDIVFVESANLLPELYTVSETRYNGVTLYPNTIIKVEKSMVFDNARTYLKANEPSCILSPNRLRIPNSSYKILGYIPDLTGKGNHGRLNNFAYTEESGANEDGSIRFDGKDDYITIPTLAHGGKCVMMKVNWSNGGMLYDQRLNSSVYTFGILTGEATLAYNARNNGSTYIDGILNANIIPSDLVGITHNITAVNDAAIDNNTVSPRLGVSVFNATFSNQALYEFMLFPEIPSEDEIKKLNDVMGIEGGYVESPNYYWDSFGKSNINKEDIDYDNLRQGTDANRQLIDKSVLGLKAIENYIKTGNGSDIVSRRLYLNNVAYNSESGYGGKGFVPFNGDWRHDENKLDFQFITNGIHVTKGKATLSNWFWTNNPTVKGAKTKYKITGVTFDRAIRFFNGLSEYQLVINKDGIYEVDGSLLVDGDGNPTGLSIGDNGWVGDCDIVIEQLTEYPNGLLLDGVDDHAVNTVIPAVTDFTVIAKREWINKDTIGNECFIHKGVINTPIGETAFMLEYEIANDTYYRSSSYGGYINIERTNRPEKIIYQTPTSYNGTAITKGSGTDTIGLTLGAVTNNYWHGVFYKLMFYTKTIDQLSINMLKNLFERDELIDVTNPIFKKQ